MSKKKIVSEVCRELTGCILTNNISQFNILFPDLTDINEKNQFGTTLLYEAVSWGRYEMIRLLLGRGANLEIPDKTGFPPFHLAMDKGDIFMTQFLYEEGVNLHSLDGFGNNPLSRILFTKNSTAQHIIIFLLRHGVNPDFPNFRGISARETGVSIANYDYASLFNRVPAISKLSERIIQYEHAFDNVVITSQEVLDGAEITVLRYYDLDRIWDFQTNLKPDARLVRVSTLASVLNRHPEIESIMSQMSINQYAMKDAMGNWSINPITQTMVYNYYKSAQD